MKAMSSEELDSKETISLIASDKVEGTKVYGADEQSIGSVERLMIDKRSGKVSYAVLSVGGFLGIGDTHHPMPWEKLSYDETLGGYRVNATRDELEGAPSYRAGEEPDWSDTAYESNVRGYYGLGGGAMPAI
jgi:hypothetical protein